MTAPNWVVKIYRSLPQSVSTSMVRLLKRTHIVGVVGVAINSKDEILVLQHTYHQPPWRLPGGMMEKGEQPFETAVREVWEEAQCVVEPVCVVGAAQLLYSFDVAVLLRVVEEKSFQQSSEISDRKWIALESADLPPAHKYFARLAYEERQLRGL